MELKIASHLGGPESAILYPFFRVLISGHVRACILTYNALLLHSSVEQYLEEEARSRFAEQASDPGGSRLGCPTGETPRWGPVHRSPVYSEHQDSCITHPEPLVTPPQKNPSL